MSDTPPFKNYSLPGDLADPKRVNRRAISMASAYSRFINPHGLESPFYGPWGDILSSLIHDSEETLSVVPQLTIYRLRRERRLSDSFSISSKASKSERDTDQGIPDFSIVASEWMYRDGRPTSQLPVDWSLLQISLTDIRGIAELKAVPSRNLKKESLFISSVTHRLKHAKF